jgi:hypothetical protein
VERAIDASSLMLLKDPKVKFTSLLLSTVIISPASTCNVFIRNFSNGNQGLTHCCTRDFGSNFISVLRDKEEDPNPENQRKN